MTRLRGRPGTRAWPGGLALIVCAAAPAASSRAEDRVLDLNWRAPAECPTGEEVTAQIEHLISGRAPGSSPTRLHAVSTIARSERGVWTVRLETNLDGARGQRVLQGDTCKAVSSATALILAMAIDPEAVGRALATAPEPVAVEVAVPAPAPGATTEVAVAPVAAAPPWRPQAAALAAVVFAELPRAAGAARLVVGVKRGRLGFAVTGLVSQEVRGDSGNRTDAGGTFRLFSAGARLCGDAWRSAVIVALCAGGSYDRVSATASGVTNPGSAVVTMLAGVGTLAISVPLTARLDARLETGFDARPYRPRFGLGGVGTVYEIPFLTASASAGVQIFF